uniref:Aquaporin 4c n=1 Tax=Glossina morsitans morsitans TaxID=37546 RepID=L7P7F5_GLOMM|nr:aquaporin 4c [Glossina morsitans morsitans]
MQFRWLSREEGWNIFARFVSEVIATFLLIFFGCMGCIKSEYITNDRFALSFHFGGAVLLLVQCCACVSGAHANPAISVAALFYGTLSWPMMFLYILAQVIGATIGYGSLLGIVPRVLRIDPNAKHGLCVATIHPEVHIWQAILLEFFATSTLVLMCCAVWDKRNSNRFDSVSIRFGLAVSSLVYYVGPYTGCSMNPARSLGPAIWNLDFTNHWLYWFSPTLGGIVTAVLWRYVLKEKSFETKEQQEVNE